MANLPLLDNDFSILRCFFPDVAVFVHGSLAQGAEKFKDIDLVVVTSFFSGIAGIKRTKIVCQLLETTDYKIDPICLTPIEFKRFLVTNNIFALTIRSNLYQIC